jgi:copper chaperone CopZ
VDAKKVSILSALAASSCCVPPLILLGLTILGVGTAGLAGFSSTLGPLKWYLLPLAMVGVGTSYWLYFREKKKCADSSCAVRSNKFTRTMLTISTIVVVGFTAWSVYPYLLGIETTPPVAGGASTHFAVFEVDGMTCGGCEIAIDGAIVATGIVDSVKSSFSESRAYVWYTDPDVRQAAILEAIASVGYTARPVKSK